MLNRLRITRPWMLLSLGGAALAALAVLAFVLFGTVNRGPTLESEGTALRWPAPKSVADLVNRGDVIATGKIVSLVRTDSEGSYEAGLVSPGPLPHSYYQVSIDSLIADDGNAATSLLLRLGGLPGPRHPRIGGRYLMVLGRNPDGNSYGVWGGWGLISIDGKSPEAFNSSRLQFADRLSSSRLLFAVQEAAPDRVKTTPAQWMEEGF